MGSPKEHFLKDKESCAKLNACTHADWFQHALILGRAELADSGANQDELRGARRFQEILLALGDPEPEPAPPYPSVGINHDLDNPRKDPEPPKKK